MVLSPTRAGVLVALVAVFGVVLWLENAARWRSTLERRLRYGVPWGSLLTVGIVVGFYLLAQGGLANPSEPVIFPYVTWSYLYPTGLVTAAIAHGSPQHIVGNMSATVVFAPLVEYAWGHYPPSARRSGVRSRRVVTDGGPDRGGLLANPWFRALVAFPAGLLLAGLLTSVFSLGPGLGFSGAVFALVGFAVVTYPVESVVALVATTAVRTAYTAVTEPVARAGIETAPPAPPAWAGIGFSAHMLGFLLGVVAGVALLRRRGRRPSSGRVFAATFLAGMAQALWLIVASGVDEFTLYRGAGVVLVAVLSVVVAVAAGGSRRGFPRPLSALPWAPTRRQLGIGWLLAVGAGAAAAVAAAVSAADAVGLAVAVPIIGAVLLALPALPPVVPDRWIGPVTRRGAATAVVALLAGLIMLASVPLGLVVVDDAAPESGSVDIRDYTVAYQDNATAAQEPLVPLGPEEPQRQPITGLVVVSEDRQLWTPAVRERQLAYEGNTTVHVGGPGWRESVAVDRTGWDVTGNGTVYTVDLTVDNETTRSFSSGPQRAHVRVDGHEFVVVPTDDGFDLRVRRNGSVLEATQIPTAGRTERIGDLRVLTRKSDDTERVVVETADTSAVVAVRERYPGRQASDPATGNTLR
jgi:membrane associated rhomboid family serine protease